MTTSLNDFTNNMFTRAAGKIDMPADKPADDRPGKQTTNKRAYLYDPTYRAKDFYDLYPAWGANHADSRFNRNEALTADPMPIMWQRPGLPFAPKGFAFRLEAGHEDDKVARNLIDYVEWLRGRNMTWVNVLAAPVVVVNGADGWQEVKGDVVITWRRHPDHTRPIRTVTILLATNQTLAEFRRTYFAMAFRALMIEVEGVYGEGVVDMWINGMFGGQHPILDDGDDSAPVQLQQRFAAYMEVANSGTSFDAEQTGPHLVAFMEAASGRMGETILHGTDWFAHAPLWGSMAERRGWN